MTLPLTGVPAHDGEGPPWQEDEQVSRQRHRPFGRGVRNNSTGKLNGTYTGNNLAVQFAMHLKKDMPAILSGMCSNC